MVLFLAFSLQDQVEKYGAYVGIAAFFGLAVLSVLYFSQARELRRLRDWAGRAPERAQELEARVTANAQAARSVQAVPRAATPAAAAAVGGAATPAAAAAGTGTAVVEPEAEKAAAGGNGAQADSAAQPEGEAPGPDGAKPAGAEDAPQAEGDEAKVAGEGKPEGEADEAKAAAGEPAPPVEGASKPAEGAEAEDSKPAAEGEEETESKPAGAAPAAPAQAGNGAPPEAGESEEPEAPPVPAPAQAGNGPVQPPGPGAPPVPRATPVPRRTPAPAAALRQPSRSTTLPPRRPAPSPPPRRDEGGHGWILPAALGVVVLAAAVFGATQLLGGDDTPAPRTPAADQPAETPDSGGGSTAEPSEAALTPATAKVAVLNGTTIEGLASNQADTLKAAGYKGEITTGNNTEQRVESTILYGDGARALARDVSRRLSIASVGQLDSDTRALGENADIVVILGQDKAP